MSNSNEIIKAIGNAFLFMTLVDYWCDRDKINSDDYDVFNPNNMNSNTEGNFFPYY